MLVSGELRGDEWYWNTYLSVPRQVDLECFAIVLKAERCHCEDDIFAVDGLALLLLTFLRCCKARSLSADVCDGLGCWLTYLRW